MAKVIFFNIPAQGHINPALAVMRELVERGEQVICVNSEETRVAHEATGAQFTAYPFIATMEGLMNNSGGGNLADNALSLVKIAEQIMPWVLDLLAREKPDHPVHRANIWRPQPIGRPLERPFHFVLEFAL